MPFPDITSIATTDTFQALFNKNNEMITRLNLLDIGLIGAGAGITVSVIGSTGGVTLSVDFSTIEEVGFKVSNTIPSGMTLGHAIGITGGTFGHVSNSSIAFSKNYLGFVSKIYPDGYRITTSGRIITGLTLSDNTLYYLSDTSNGITSTVPTTNGQVIKPVLFSIGATFGAIVLNQKETLISESTSYIKSASRTIAEIPFHSGLSAGNIVFYDIPGATWAKSKATGFNTSEVFGVIESVVGATATIVTHGSVNIPNSMLNDVGLAGSSGGNDIWFLSGQTAGQLQNLGPTFANQIIKPVYYAYSHGYDGVTFSGLLVNYIGYSVDSSASAGGSSSSSLGVGSLYLGLTAEENVYLTTFSDTVFVNSTNVVSLCGQVYMVNGNTAIGGTVNTGWISHRGKYTFFRFDNPIKSKNLWNAIAPLFTAYNNVPEWMNDINTPPAAVGQPNAPQRGISILVPGAVVDLLNNFPEIGTADNNDARNQLFDSTGTVSIGRIISQTRILIHPVIISNTEISPILTIAAVDRLDVEVMYWNSNGTVKITTKIDIPGWESSSNKFVSIILPDYGVNPVTKLVIGS